MTSLSGHLQNGQVTRGSCLACPSAPRIVADASEEKREKPKPQCGGCDSFGRLQLPALLAVAQVDARNLPTAKTDGQ